MPSFCLKLFLYYTEWESAARGIYCSNLSNSDKVWRLLYFINYILRGLIY